MAYILAFLIVRSGERSVIGGLKIATLIWIGFVATVLGTQYVFEARSLAYFGITAGYPLIGLLIMGAVLGSWHSGSHSRYENEDTP